jgi:hypothetical protein
MSLRKPIVFALTGSSLTTGRLSTDWVPRLMVQLRQQPECKGEVVVYNMGKGSQTSDFGRTNAPLLSQLKPTHILFEGFGINDCAIGPLTLSQSTANFNAMVSEWRANIPGVDLTHQTMSPAWVSDTNRTNLQNFYNNELANAATLGVASLNHTPAWAPIDASNTYGAPSGDCLHPIQAAFDAYSYPSILAWAKSKMGAYWP